MRLSLSALVLASLVKTECCTEDLHDAVADHFSYTDPSHEIRSQPLPYIYYSFFWNDASIEVYHAKLNDDDFFRVLNGSRPMLSTNQPVAWYRFLFDEKTNDFYLILSDKEIASEDEANLNGLAIATYPR